MFSNLGFEVWRVRLISFVISLKLIFLALILAQSINNIPDDKEEIFGQLVEWIYFKTLSVSRPACMLLHLFSFRIVRCSMKSPTSYKEGVLSKLTPILNILENEDMAVSLLYSSTKNQFTGSLSNLP